MSNENNKNLSLSELGIIYASIKEKPVKELERLLLEKFSDYTVYFAVSKISGDP
jgi:hypothetical protein